MIALFLMNNTANLLALFDAIILWIFTMFSEKETFKRIFSRKKNTFLMNGFKEWMALNYCIFNLTIQLLKFDSLIDKSWIF